MKERKRERQRKERKRKKEKRERKKREKEKRRNQPRKKQQQRLSKDDRVATRMREDARKEIVNRRKKKKLKLISSLNILLLLEMFKAMDR